MTVDKSNIRSRLELNGTERQLHEMIQDRSKSSPVFVESSSFVRSQKPAGSASSLLEVLRQGAPLDFKVCIGDDAWLMDKQTLQSPFGSHDWVSTDANVKISFVDRESDLVGQNGGVRNADLAKATLRVVTLEDVKDLQFATLEHCKTLLNARQELDTMVAVYSQMKWPLDKTLLQTNLPPLAREIVRSPGKPDGIKLSFEMPDREKWNVTGFYLKIPTLGINLRSFLTDTVTRVAEKLAAKSIGEAKEILSSYYNTIFHKFLPSLIQQLQQLDSARIYHFDIKPANLLVAEDGTARIIGWGAAFKFNDAEQAMMDKANVDLLAKLDPLPRTTQYSSYSKGLPLQSWPLFAAALSMVEALVPLPTEQVGVSSSSNMQGTAFSHLVLHNALDESNMPALGLEKVEVDTDIGKAVDSISSRMTRTIRAGEPDLPALRWSKGIGSSLSMLKPLISQELANHKSLCVFKSLEKMLEPAIKLTSSVEARGIRDSRSTGLHYLSDMCGLKPTRESLEPSNTEVATALETALDHMLQAVQALERVIPIAGPEQIVHH